MTQDTDARYADARRPAARERAMTGYVGFLLDRAGTIRDIRRFSSASDDGAVLAGWALLRSEPEWRGGEIWQGNRRIAWIERPQAKPRWPE